MFCAIEYTLYLNNYCNFSIFFTKKKFLYLFCSYGIVKISVVLFKLILQIMEFFISLLIFKLFININKDIKIS